MGLDDFAEFASDVADFAEAAIDVASETLSDGLEYLSDGFLDGFDQLQEQVGSFAGEGSWFDTNFAGDIFGGPEALGDLGGAGFGGGFFDSISDFATDLQISVLGPELVAGPGAGQSLFGQLVDKASSFVPSFDTLAAQAQKSITQQIVQTGIQTAAGAINSQVAGIPVVGSFAAGVVNKTAGAVNSSINQQIAGRPVTFPSLSQITGITPNIGIPNVPGIQLASLGNNIPLSLLKNQTGTASVNATTDPQSQEVDTYTTDSLGNTFKTLPDGTSSLVRAAEVAEDISADTPGLVTSSQTPPSASQVDQSASNVGYITVQNPEDGTYYVQNEATGAIVASGLTEQAAILTSQDQTFIDAGAATDPNLATPPANAGSVATGAANNAPVADPNVNGPPVSLGNAAAIAAAAAANAVSTAAADAAARTTALITQAQRQQTIRAQRQNQAQAGDWRVRLRLAPTSNYLYNAPDCGQVLWPLRNTDGVIFPYTPSIDTSYKANYSTYDLTHSNYRGYFYQNSYVDGINIKATFTAQDTAEANYLLAVIHFFRSVTKMFYGQDAERGSPPPLTYLSGLGDFQFNEHPCVVSQFNYNLPADVNYIRAQSVLVNGTNLISARRRQTVLGNPLSYAIQRLSTLGQGIQPGAVDAPFAAQGSLGAKNPTYVPTKMDINLTLLPIQSRSQVSQLFSLKGFANGNLLKGGFW
jgi:hypothetical protein